ncbi:High affinity cationic amino acid transporter 1 isoform 2 [Schistosoma japonicum]|uniref:High affinity cationic amino acid transporter 1 isoform 2 n=3 Tax=Schistosoma japonicum TaxID=6182 RepID=A0A4Z2D5D0_SCHJA|nr:High affinity cationic amino acid transporter 1 isoform 2 [Schistosoma japonicum]
MSSCVRKVKRFLTSLNRKKIIKNNESSKYRLRRCLAAYDLIALGVGTTLGAGVYILVGDVAKSTAGPGVIISFLIAAIASVLSGLCYAEFGARVPQSGSAYAYSYITVGEIMAFTIGWNLVLEYVIGTASVARAWSSNFDGLFNGQLTAFFEKYLKLNLPGLAEYADPLAVGMIILMTILLSVGVRESAMINNVFTVINLCVIAFIVITGLIYADINNWKVIPENVFTNGTSKSTTVGKGGFLPFGFNGVLSGAGTCFFAFVGFDIIATTGEEVRNPQKSIPISIIGCLLICFMAYGLISATLTLMMPYYALSSVAPLPLAFSHHGLQWAKYIISTGALCALTTSLLGSMFPLPRILYSMASDGLLFSFLSRINSRVKTPLFGTVISGVIGCIMAAVFSLQDLVDMMSIGTLLAYTLVSFSVLLLRGQVMSIGHCLNDANDDNEDCAKNYHEILIENEGEKLFSLKFLNESVDNTFNSNKEASNDYIDNSDYEKHSISLGKISIPNLSNSLEQTDTATDENSQVNISNYFQKCFKPEFDVNKPSKITEFVYKINSYLLLCTIFLSNFGILLLDKLPEETTIRMQVKIPIWIFIGLMILISAIICSILAKQPENQTAVSFKVPGVPWIPALSIFINVYLMVKLSGATWVRFLVWMVVGFTIYFGYGYWHSNERKRKK